MECGCPFVEGEVIASVGNNGYVICPHIHIGAWIDAMPLSIKFDPEKVAKIYAKVGEIFWLSGLSEEEFIARKG